MAALSLVSGKLAVLVVLALHLFLNIWLGKQMFETSSEFAILIHIGCLKGKGSFLHFVKGLSVHKFSLRLMWNVGPTYVMVGGALEPNHINPICCSATESKLTVLVELCANAIQQNIGLLSHVYNRIFMISDCYVIQGGINLATRRSRGRTLVYICMIERYGILTSSSLRIGLIIVLRLW